MTRINKNQHFLDNYSISSQSYLDEELDECAFHRKEYMKCLKEAGGSIFQCAYYKNQVSDCELRNGHHEKFIKKFGLDDTKFKEFVTSGLYMTSTYDRNLPYVSK